MERKELIDIVVHIEHSISHIRENINKWKNNELKEQMEMLANRIKFFLWDGI